MTGTLVEIRHNKRDIQHTLGLDKGLRDALADHWRSKWQGNAAKLGAREYGLTLDEARGVLAGRASLTTIERIIKSENGGWALIFDVMASVIGQRAEHFIIERRKAHAENAERLGALVGDWWGVPSDRGSDAAPRRRSTDLRRVPDDDRAAGTDG